MRRRGGRGGRATLAAAVILAASWFGAAPVRAADDDFALPDGALGMVTADLDGDGTREIVRLIDSDEFAYSVEAWSESSSGWTELGSARLVTHAPENPVPSRQPMAGILRWTLDGAERVLAVTALSDPTGGGVQCCFGISLLRMAGGRLVVHEIGQDIEALGDSLTSLDMDGDGTDELVTWGYTFENVSGDPELFYLINRWHDGRFETIHFDSGLEMFGGLATGDADGDGADDVLIGPDDEGRLIRASLISGEVVTDEGRVTPADGSPAFLQTVVDGRLVMAGIERLSVVRWPRGADPETVDRVDFPNVPRVFVVSDGDDSIIVATDGDLQRPAGPTTRVYDLDLRFLGEVAPAPAVAAAVAAAFRLESQGSMPAPYPYIGPLPDGAIQRPAVAIAGQAISPDGGGGFLTVTISPLMGLTPIGVAGRDRVVLGRYLFSSSPDGRTAFLSAGFYPFVDGGAIVTPRLDRLGIDPDAADTVVELTGVIEERIPGGRRIRAPSDGFTASISAIAGSTIFLGNGSETTQWMSRGKPINVTLRPRSNASNGRDEPFDRWILIVLPDGRATAEDWSGAFVRTPLALEADAATRDFTFGTRVSGVTEPGTTVSIGDTTVVADGAGAFSLDVGAVPWPADVVVHARDPLGRTASARLQVIGFLDYRGLPWVPILGLLTVVAGVILYLRTPRNRPAAERPVVAGDATLEEIEGD